MAQADARIAVDVGGTFTDLVLVRGRTGRMAMAKVRTTPDDPVEGLVAGVERLLGPGGVAAADVTGVLFASTAATNAVLQRAGARVGLLVTAGFRHILEIARANIPGRLTNELTYQRPERLVPLERVLEVDERCGADGAVLRPLDTARARQAIRALLAQRVEVIAVSLLHAYANPVHERALRALIEEEGAGLPVSLSSEILPEYREYERTMTTVLNAYVTPVMQRMVHAIQARLGQVGVRAPLGVVRSDGGIMSAAAVVQRPVNTILSGPAAGVYGAAHVARLAGYASAISLDMGGTSTDVSLAAGGAARIRADAAISEYPVRLPVMDIVTIGAGGGSIASVSATGALHVGPRSAGADPGPVCYDRGGTEVTVTDANLLLGRLPSSLAGGEIALNVDLARTAMTALAQRVGMDPMRLAAGIVTIAVEKMLGALRVVSVERGYDPREFVLIAFGGAGPMHAGELCRRLGIGTAVIPPTPGVLSAVGALVADVTCVVGRTQIQPMARVDLAEANATLAALAAEADSRLAEEGIPPARREIRFAADLRYAGQASELTVVTADALTSARMAETVDAFHGEHRRLFGFDWNAQVPVELVGLKAMGIGRVEKPELLAWSVAGGRDARDARTGHRTVWFDGEAVETSCYDRLRLAPGGQVVGPAIIEQVDCTTVICPGQVATVDRFLNLVVCEA